MTDQEKQCELAKLAERVAEIEREIAALVRKVEQQIQMNERLN
jgi:hypothetical protein